jgi:sugar phosphate isomerase/epimerase
MKWTKEQAMERAKAWDERVKAGEFRDPGNEIDWGAVFNAEKEQGYTYQELVAEYDRWMNTSN